MDNDELIKKKQLRKAIRDKRIEDGLCIRCSNNSMPGKSMCEKCLALHRGYYYKSIGTRMCKLCGINPAEKKKEQCKSCIEQRDIRLREKREEIRKEVYIAYGGVKCNCCGECEYSCLEIDHIDNNGEIDRKTGLKKAGIDLCIKLKKMGYPPGYQVLCCNCNQSKRRNGGICAHKTKLDYLLSGVTPEMRENLTLEDANRMYCS
jgi:hypothetical protein